METRKKSPRAKKKMTREEMQLALIKKKECDAKALTIVEQLLEPEVDPAWLVDNLKNISKCHMDDVIEERAITRVCGYVLCKKPLTVLYKQQYHISLKDKKVYDITKRKNFCSSACYGASNYLLEQMLTSPLWMRDKEEIPKFRIFTVNKRNSTDSSSKKCAEVDITTTRGITNKDDENQNDTKNVENPIEGCIEEFVLETVKEFELKSNESEKINSEKENSNLILKSLETNKDTKMKISGENTGSKKSDIETNINRNEKSTHNDNTMKENCEIVEDDSDDDIIEQCVYPIQHAESESGDDKSIEQCVHPEARVENETNSLNNVKENVNQKQEISNDSDDDIIEQCIYTECRTSNDDFEDVNINVQKEKYPQNFQDQTNTNSQEQEKLSRKIEDKQDRFPEGKIENGRNTNYREQEEKDANNKTSSVNDENKKLKPTNKTAEITETMKMERKKKKMKRKDPLDGNLASRVENSFQEWITEETINYLFGDASVKQEAIDRIERQDKYDVLCKKLNRLQFEEEKEDAEILQKPILKPAPHFAVLKEESEKLDLKVRAFYQGKTAYEESIKSTTSEEVVDLETFLPLTESHAPQILRRKIFLERLDQVLPDLLRTLAGNNEVYARASLNYTSARCTAVKALVHTFSLSAKNIIFKTAEWTLVGLVIIKMLSLSDPCLASLLSIKQANLYISMILTAYKLNSDYLNLLVASFNPNINPR